MGQYYMGSYCRPRRKVERVSMPQNQTTPLRAVSLAQSGSRIVRCRLTWSNRLSISFSVFECSSVISVDRYLHNRLFPPSLSISLFLLSTSRRGARSLRSPLSFLNPRDHQRWLALLPSCCWQHPLLLFLGGRYREVTGDNCKSFTHASYP